jgi:CO/xanthine dehydrogenase Mo-binding subunit/aerobic-type carbon monoxide dehydrogenase small subunit (CoxS/CutS family)
MSAARPLPAAAGTTLRVNGRSVTVDWPPATRLTAVLRDALGMSGTKVGCDAGDCGACTVLLDGRQACACLVPLGQAAGAEITTVEGLMADPRTARLQDAFGRSGAVQCGICTPGMLMAAAELVRAGGPASRAAIADALGGVLCRCTGYLDIVAAVETALAGFEPVVPVDGPAVGARIAKLDARAKVTGAERYGADEAPAAALWLELVRSPHAHARFTLGDLAPLRARFPGLVAILTAADIPCNRYGIFPQLRDQPVLADGLVRHRGEPVLALVADQATLAAIAAADLPITWQPLDPVLGLDAALAPGAPQLHPGRPGNLLTEGRLERGPLPAAPAITVAGQFETSFVEHAYIEPEAGWALREGERVTVAATTQSPYMDRDEVAHVLGLAPERVRIRPTACGGGFGGKLDLSVQPILAVAAWRLGRPVRAVWQRSESMAATTKRHPARTEAAIDADRDGRILAVRFAGDFDTGAYASWGPTVAGRVPIHCMGPYRVPAVRARARAVHTNGPPSGAFRGFGVPQALIATETLLDEVAERLGIDALELRLRNALRPGDATATGQVLASCGLVACLEALRPRWQALRAARRAAGPLRRGVGLACMWYGCGNTGMSNPATQRATVQADGRIVLWNGVQDIGQGSNTIMAQILADAMGVPVAAIATTSADTDRTLDCGKTSASRQTFVSGEATRRAGVALRAAILRHANAGADAAILPEAGRLEIVDGARRTVLEPARLAAGADGAVLEGIGSFDPPASPLAADGTGAPYATYGFGAQLAAVAVDVELGTVRVERIVAAHDVGRAINPQQVEGQIKGGIAQGLGLALMEEFVPGRTENLHDYLIPTVGDVPEIEIHLVEDAEPLGPFGAKGVGEPALVPTAPAILNAIHDAVGVRLRHVPALPHRVLAALRR